MTAFFTQGKRPFQCARAMLRRGLLSGPSGVLSSAAERLSSVLISVAAAIRSRAVVVGAATAVSQGGNDAPRVSHVEPVPSPFRKKDAVDQASWESFPASDPPGY